MISSLTKFNPTLSAVVGAALLLTACDSTNTVGGAAGDSDDSLAAAIALLAPYAGIYDLQDGWNGLSGDEAFLVIEIPGSDAIAPSALYDFDDFDNCVPVRPSTGEVYKDPFSDRIFMDDILQFGDAELFLSGSTLTIEFTDFADLDNDGSTQDDVSVTAFKLGISQVSDLGDTCT